MTISLLPGEIRVVPVRELGVGGFGSVEDVTWMLNTFGGTERKCAV